MKIRLAIVALLALLMSCTKLERDDDLVKVTLQITEVTCRSDTCTFTGDGKLFYSFYTGSHITPVPVRGMWITLMCNDTFYCKRAKYPISELDAFFISGDRNDER